MTLSSRSAPCSDVPPLRCRAVNERPIQAEADYVLYWMTAYRRPRYNFALQRALDWALELQRPLIVLEALRSDYRWASPRFHAFVVQGMVDQAAYFQSTRVAYYPYIEPQPGAGAGLVASLAKHACLVVSDDFPCFFLPAMMRHAAQHIDVALELVDSNGLLPMRAADKVFLRAFDFRRFLQSNLANHWNDWPLAEPSLPERRRLAATQVSSSILRRWPAADLANWQERLARGEGCPGHLPVPSVPQQGGFQAAAKRLSSFLRRHLNSYAEERNRPDDDISSGLSPYLHFGHISSHEVFQRVVEFAGWERPERMPRATGQREGWWSLPPSVEEFLDQLITWRELGYNFCSQRSDYDRYSSLPDWAQATLHAHASDRRETIYTLEAFEAAETHDPLWNAAQRQLVREGRLHNYLRMLWGKKILEWSRSPQVALEIMIELNNKYALDGRNPNSYSGIFWTLGRYDRAWGPERPIFGTIRYMSSDNTARKVPVREYLRRYAHQAPTQQPTLF